MAATWTGTDGAWAFEAPDQPPLALGNLRGMTAWCAHCHGRTDHNSRWHEDRMWPPQDPR